MVVLSESCNQTTQRTYFQFWIVNQQSINNFSLSRLQAIKEKRDTAKIITDGMQRETICDKGFISDIWLIIIQGIFYIFPGILREPIFSLFNLLLIES